MGLVRPDERVDPERQDGPEDRERNRARVPHASSLARGRRDTRHRKRSWHGLWRPSTPGPGGLDPDLASVRARGSGSYSLADREPDLEAVRALLLAGLRDLLDHPAP